MSVFILRLLLSACEQQGVRDVVVDGMCWPSIPGYLRERLSYADWVTR